MDGEGDAPNGLETAVVVDVEVLDYQTGLAGCRRGLRRREAALRARPSTSRDSASVAPALGIVSIFFPRRNTVMRSATRAPRRSLWLMKMIDLPCGAGSRGSSNSSRASCGVRTAVGSSRIEDVRAAVERLEDLDALLLRHRERVDAGVGVDGEAELLAELAHARARPLAVEKDPGVVGSTASTMFSATVITGIEHEVLVHHADAGARSRRWAERSRPAGRRRRISPASGLYSP